MGTKRCRGETGVDSMKLADLLMQLARGRRGASPAAGRVFECMTCSRQFPSFQALGGHRAGHKKPKASADHETTPSTTSAKAKAHECSVCGLQFATGQALGGHMRRHRASVCHGSAEKQQQQQPSEGRRVLLDLNLPPLEEEGDIRILGLSLGLGLGLAC